MEEKRCMEEERRAVLLFAFACGLSPGQQSRQLGAGQGALLALCSVHLGTAMAPGSAGVQSTILCNILFLFMMKTSFAADPLQVNVTHMRMCLSTVAFPVITSKYHLKKQRELRSASPGVPQCN